MCRSNPLRSTSTLTQHYQHGNENKTAPSREGSFTSPLRSARLGKERARKPRLVTLRQWRAVGRQHQAVSSTLQAADLQLSVKDRADKHEVAVETPEGWDIGSVGVQWHVPSQSGVSARAPAI